MTKLAALGIIGTLALVPVGLAQSGHDRRTPDNPGDGAPWQWSSEDRINRRAEEFARHSAEKNTDDVWLSGSQRPELILPWEALVHLSVTVYGEDADANQVARQRYAKRSDGVVTGDEFWTRLENAIGPYLASGEVARNLTPSLQDMTDVAKRDAIIKETDLSRCRARAVSLENAYSVFGKEEFDKFLYKAVVPDINFFGDNPDKARLDYLTRGCR